MDLKKLKKYFFLSFLEQRGEQRWFVINAASKTLSTHISAIAKFDCNFRILTHRGQSLSHRYNKIAQIEKLD